MVTLDQIKEALGEGNDPFQVDGIDHGVLAIALLRDRIPYEVCKRIIDSSDYDILYLCKLDDVLPYIDEGDLKVLAECNVGIDDDFGRLVLYT